MRGENLKEKINQAITLLEEIMDDKSVPKNIRDAARKSKESLEEEGTEIGIRVDRVIQYMDEVSDDPNMPIYTRTQIWNIISILESLLS